MDFRNCHPPHSNELLTHKAAREATDELATLLKVLEQPAMCNNSLYLLYANRTISPLLSVKLSIFIDGITFQNNEYIIRLGIIS